MSVCIFRFFSSYFKFYSFLSKIEMQKKLNFFFYINLYEDYWNGSSHIHINLKYAYIYTNIQNIWWSMWYRFSFFLRTTEINTEFSFARCWAFGLCVCVSISVSYVIPSHIKMLIDENFFSVCSHMHTPYCRRMDFRGEWKSWTFCNTISINFLHDRKKRVEKRDRDIECVYVYVLALSLSFLFWHFSELLPSICNLYGYTDYEFSSFFSSFLVDKKNKMTCDFSDKETVFLLRSCKCRIGFERSEKSWLHEEKRAIQFTINNKAQNRK